MRSKNHEHLIDETPFGVFGIYDAHRKNYVEAIRRIDVEGQVVRDMRGAVVPHPSLAIQQTSAEAMLVILKQYGSKQHSLLDDLT